MVVVPIVVVVVLLAVVVVVLLVLVAVVFVIIVVAVSDLVDKDDFLDTYDEAETVVTKVEADREVADSCKAIRFVKKEIKK